MLLLVQISFQLLGNYHCVEAVHIVLVEHCPVPESRPVPLGPGMTRAAPHAGSGSARLLASCAGHVDRPPGTFPPPIICDF